MAVMLWLIAWLHWPVQTTTSVHRDTWPWTWAGRQHRPWTRRSVPSHSSPSHCPPAPRRSDRTPTSNADHTARSNQLVNAISRELLCVIEHPPTEIKMDRIICEHGLRIRDILFQNSEKKIMNLKKLTSEKFELVIYDGWRCVSACIRHNSKT